MGHTRQQWQDSRGGQGILTSLSILFELVSSLSSTVTLPLFISSTPVLLVPPSLRLPQAWNNWSRRKGRRDGGRRCIWGKLTKLRVLLINSSPPTPSKASYFFFKLYFPAIRGSYSGSLLEFPLTRLKSNDAEPAL